MTSEQYFSVEPESPLRRRRIDVTLAGRDVTVTTAAGVFSPDRVDQGTSILLSRAPAPPASGHLLDVGCGWGPLALTLALQSPDATVWAVDVNERVLDLVRENARGLGLENVNAVRPEDVPDEVRFAALWSNPPIRVGKRELHDIVSRWLPRLEPGADAWLVVQKHLGADSLQRWIADELGDVGEVSRTSTDKNFRVLRATRR